MKSLEMLLDKNKLWAKQIEADNPDFFKGLIRQQTPEYLWIGCSDSRVPANQIVDLPPGEMFVHRNIANIVPYSDINVLSVIQYAVEVLKVKHIIVCGHYGCGGVKSALANRKLGLIDNWLSHIKDIYMRHEHMFSNIESEDERVNLLCELNVAEQVKRVCHSSIVQDAWKLGHELTIHGWIYDLNDGILKDLEITVDQQKDIHKVFRLEE
tara:strand:- start:18872 stop:19504 length:633 start_codon:yes stop_codon:yes gene_type:complete